MEVNAESEQTPEERRRTRLKYRNFIEELQENKDELTNPESNQLHERLDEADELFKPVKNAREAVLDSQAISMIANLGRINAQNLQTDFIRFQPTEFVEKLKGFVDGRRATPEGSRVSARGWEHLGRAVQAFFQRAPIITYMYGAFERGPRPVKERQKTVKPKDNVVGKETVPKQLKNFAEEEKMEVTTEEVERVLNLLKQHSENQPDNPIGYFEFVLNPDSFGHTVENIFHVSFLIRDGLAEISLDGDKLPVIRPVSSKEMEEDKNQRGRQRHQTIISITPKHWRELVDTFQITEAAIPAKENQ